MRRGMTAPARQRLAAVLDAAAHGQGVVIEGGVCAIVADGAPGILLGGADPRAARAMGW
jgi:hypothetical protein